MNEGRWSPERWAQKLWAYFKPEVQHGRPVYFAVDQYLLHEFLREENPLSQVDPVDSLKYACRQLFRLEGRKAALLERTFVRNDNGLSNAICFVALEVLAVELMMRDRSFTEEAYFPRLRDLLGIDVDGNLSSDPFIQGDFDRIWKTLSNEIKRVPGGGQHSITFAKGTGRNVHRQYPISQAMLTKDDLCRLQQSSPDAFADITTLADAFHFLLNHRTVLPGRAKSIVNTAARDGARRLRLSHQLLDFAQNTPVHVPIEKVKSGSRSAKFVAYRTVDFFSDDKIHLYYVDEQGVEQISRTAQQVLTFCGDNKMLLLVESDNRFTTVGGREPLSVGETYLIICQEDRIKIVDYILQKVMLPNEGLSAIECVLPRGYLAFLYTLDTNPAHPLWYKAGKLCFDEKDRIQALSLEGGLLIDGRKKQYLSPYCPRALSVGGKKLAHHVDIQVNDETMSVGQFFGQLHRGMSFPINPYTVVYGGRRLSFEMRTIDSQVKCDFTLGYPLESDELSPTIALVEPEDEALIGMSLRSSGKFRTPLSARQSKERHIALSLLSLPADSTDKAISHQDVEAIESLLEGVGFPNAATMRIKTRLQHEQAIPPIAWSVLVSQGCISGTELPTQNLCVDAKEENL
ncbi:hypothetical protein [Microbulbifer rhizosphaerae]|uniref:Uncharacterized protein n=1 Tax=Microbulbifer rhizosphaerae TaxID=1562603 RepID=A0A7W4W8W3_9GAMM|nr:hypothetical protein [Microbulbifer rhizosphaerae]MBB3059243.1 hypothetical protein [Microbulbifer rhizosphaerae]